MSLSRMFPAVTACLASVDVRQDRLLRTGWAFGVAQR